MVVLLIWHFSLNPKIFKFAKSKPICLLLNEAYTID